MTKRVVKKHKFSIFVSTVILFLFLSGIVLGSDVSLNPRTSDEDAFSDKLKYNPYDNFDSSFENWFDGVETFFFDGVGTEPSSFGCLPGTGISYEISDLDGHNHISKLIDASVSNKAEVRYYMNLTEETNSIISFWMYSDAKDFYFRLYNSSDIAMFEIEFRDSDGYVWINDLKHSTYSQSFAFTSKWYKFDIKMSGNDLLIYCVDEDYVSKITGLVVEVNFDEFEKLEFATKESASGGNMGFDALCFYQPSEPTKFITQIKGDFITITYNFRIVENKYPLTASDVFSNYENLIDEVAVINNNYREYTMTDVFSNDNFMSKERIMRKTDLDETESKYKVVQFYLDDLDNQYTLGVNGTNDKTNNNENYEFVVNNGTLTNEGDLNEIDADYFEVDSTNQDITSYYESFTDVPNGELPDYYNDLDGTNCISQVVASYDGRNKVLSMDDNQATAGTTYVAKIQTDVDYLIDTSPNGSISFWFQRNSAYDCTMMFYNVLGESLMGINYNYGNLNLYGDVSDSMAHGYGSWFKFQLDYDTTEYGFKGLAQNDYQMSIDDAVELEATMYVRDDMQLSHYMFTTRSAHTLQMWFDDIQFISADFNNYTANFTVSRELDLTPACDNYEINLNFASNIDLEFINTSVYNYYTNSWEYFESDTNDVVYDLEFVRRYINSTNELKVNFELYTNLSAFYINVDFLNISCVQYNSTNVGLHQKIELRVDSFGVSGLTMNKYFFNVELLNDSGVITWEVLYRDPDYPIWTPTPTNPIFNFSDYIGNDTVLQELQISLHFKLNEIDGHVWFDIRTIVCFNNIKENTYEYDKVIDGGWGQTGNTFYDDQTRLNVKYIDYFNYNTITHRYDITGNDYFRNETYNNLRGIRTLCTNDELYYQSFLSCGFFTDRFQIAEDPKPEDHEGDEPDEPKRPTKRYWKYTTFTTVEYGSRQIYYYDDVDFFDTTIPIESDYEHSTIKGEERKAKYPYTKEIFKPKDFGNWKFKIVTLKVNFNKVRNTICDFANSFALLIQYFFFLVFWALSYVFTYLVVVLMMPFLWNYLIYYLVIIGIVLIHYIQVTFVWVVGQIWTFLNLIWEVFLIPFFGWFLTDALPFLIELFIEVWAIIIAVILTVLAGEEIGGDYYNNILDQTRDMLTQIADFLLDSIRICLENIDAIVYAILLYVMFIAFCYVKYWYCKSQGNIPRAEELKDSFDAYILPFRIVFNIYDRVKNSVPTA